MKNVNLKFVLKQIKNHQWWSEEGPGVYAFIGWPLRAFIEQAKYFHPRYLSISIFIYRNDFFYEETPADEKSKIYDYIFQKVRQNRNWLIRLRKNSEKSAARSLAAGDRMIGKIEKLSNQQLWKNYQKFSADYLDYVRYGAAIECVDIFSSEVLPGLIKKEITSLGENETLDLAFTLVAPLRLSFFEKEELLFFEAARLGYEALSDKPRANLRQIYLELPQLESKLKKLVRSYFWIGNNFQKAIVLTENDFLGRVRELTKDKSRKELIQIINNFKTKIKRLKKAKAKYLKRYKFSQNLLLHFWILFYIAEWIDDRKRFMTIANHYNEIFCQEIAKRFGLNIGLVKSYILEEFENLLLRNKKVSLTVIKNRRRFSVQVVARKDSWRFRESIFYGKQAKIIYDSIFKLADKKEIKGQVASAPVKKLEGKVQVVLDVNKSKFKSGNILVTTMTRPEFIPLLRKAKAIITDEGGLTCHAAIISRELGIPCIIGTKIATKVLKDGDRVEVDATRGVVKKIN